MKRIVTVILVFFTTVLLVECARKGRPEGGPKDEDAPIMVMANPPYQTTNFNEREIKIYFDEYVVLRDLTRQLVVSPPMKNPPLIEPQGTPSKEITIKILDTLKTNTTYIFNFGNAVQDNNENNKLENFKYVFSTGNFIDSLTLNGSVIDPLSDKKIKEISVALYRLDSSYTDSIIYKQKPDYVSSTLDSTEFSFTNLRKGDYILAAIEEEAKDYIFDPINDKMAFSLDTISLPKDSILLSPLLLFKQSQKFTFKRGKEVSKGKIQFSFTGGNKDDFDIELLSDVLENYKAISHYEANKDTLNYWFTPVEEDSLNFKVLYKNTAVDTSVVRFRKKKIDSLEISPSIGGTMHPKDTFFIKTNNPITNVDISKIIMTDKDTLAVSFKELPSKNENKLAILFDKKLEERYTIKLLPNALTDIFEQTNDTLKFNFATRKLEDYGVIELDVQNVGNKNIILELVSKNKVVEREYLSVSKKLKFENLQPKEYIIRAIIDRNNDKKWTTGNFLKKQLPETIIYFDNEINLRANWTINETFTIK